ncbi:MAG TPA: DUF2142 domain-containing protein, partial [Euzebya sp.]|nr:DUF2142 domain-containing protein [Euzebya sp.]
MGIAVPQWIAVPSWSRTFVAALGVWLVLGATWAVASPPFSVPDEPSHAVRAASVAGGQLLGERREVEFEGPPLIRRVEHLVQVPAALAGADAMPRCFAFAQGTADCVIPLEEIPGVAEVATTAGAYQPLFYLLVGTPLQVLSPTEGLYGARLLHVVAGALLLAAAFATAWDLGGRLFVVVVSLAVTPIVGYLLGSINPSGLEIAAALALWCGALGLVLRAQTRYAAITAAALITLAWTRPLSPLIAIGIVGAVMAAAASPSRMRALWRPVLVGVPAVGLIGVVAAVGWLVAAQAGDAFVGTP